MTLKEWVYLVWSSTALYDGHNSGEHIRCILNRIGGPYGFIVDDALDGYERFGIQESDRRQTRQVNAGAVSDKTRLPFD
jgi:hypothetical protein